jgi:26S proteasome regulatory subunit N10
MGKLLACFARVKIGGKSNLSTSVQIAKLALKHRQNTRGSKRIILFVGSPVCEKEAVLIKLGKQLRKDDFAIDVISIGEIEENNDILASFVKEVNKEVDNRDNSHLFSIPAGVSPCDAILSSPILGGDVNSGMAPGGGGNADQGGGFEDYGGFDPEMDPELAMAIRVSTEEARAAEESRNKAQQEVSGGRGSGSLDGVVPQIVDSAIHATPVCVFISNYIL